MRRTLAIALGIILAAAPAATRAQEETEQAAALKAQLAALQQKLDDLARKEAADHKFTEIGSSASRSRAEADPRRVVRIYDISDLYAIAPAYAAQEPGDLAESPRAIFPEVELSSSAAAGLGGGGFGGGVFAVPSTISGGPLAASTLRQVTGSSGASSHESVRTSVNNLIDTITTTIEPEAWKEVGGPCTITSLGASLVVSASTDMHGQIAALLDLFRKRWGSLRTVSVQAHWLWLTEDQLSASLAEGSGLKPPAPFGALSKEAWTKIMTFAQAEEQKRTNYHAVITCYNGQTVSTLAGSQRLIVGGLTPVVGSGKESAAYQPQMRMIQDGAALQITPVVTRTAKYVVADVHSRVNLLTPAIPPAAANKDTSDITQVVAALDRPDLESQRLATTLRIPVDMPTLVGGMTFATKGNGDANLYLFLTATVRELRDEEGTELKVDDKQAK